MPPASPASSPQPLAGNRDALADRLAAVRAQTLRLAATLTSEGQCVQSMPDASPVKWHLAHTSWFFEAVVLGPHDQSYRCFHPAYSQLFNSHDESLEPRDPRAQRGLLTRPSLDAVHAYRAHVDAAMRQFLATAGAASWQAAAPFVELGLQHEQQHQELIATDILHAFSCNPLLPAWQPQDQQVLRGSSVYTAQGHARPTYRNFFAPAARWQCTGVRLGKDVA